jgi:uncharacterized coiled-coil protein SlyX
MKVFGHVVLVGFMLGSAIVGRAQPAAPPIAHSADRNAQVQQKIEAISAALAATQQQIDQSQRQMQQLQQQLLELRQQIAASGSVPAPTAPTAAESGSSSTSVTAATPDATVPLEERVETLEAAVKLHDKTKVESTSKYPVRLTGLILFNGFLNKGVADNIDLPAYALHSSTTSGNGSLGASMRQTILGVEGDGPRLGSAYTSANVSLDFFSSVSYTGYGTSAGVVRLRTAAINFDWAEDSLQVGFVQPLISPLSPDSFATVAEPSLSGAGNLWTWAPQLAYAHKFPVNRGNRLQFQFGLWDPAAAGYNTNQLFRVASPGELAEQPAYESRISYGSTADHGLQLGVGGYYSRQAYPGYQGYVGTEHLEAWATTFDFRAPLNHHLEISGEGYRGRSIGGLGGGVYKDIIPGTSPTTGNPVLRPLNAIGGWTQFKARFNSSLDANFSIGQDNGFAADFHAVVIAPTTSATQLRARNRMFVSNLIYRPRTYIILSPEYRRIWSWPITGSANTLNIYTLSIGFQF